MKRGFKPYSKRKPFKRKTGGPKFMLGSKTVKYEIPGIAKSLLQKLFLM